MSVAVYRRLEKADRPLAYEIRRVDFEIPEPFTEITFGQSESTTPMSGRFPNPRRTLVVSPFVSDGLLKELATDIRRRS